MVEKEPEVSWLNWRLPLYAGLTSLLVSVGAICLRSLLPLFCASLLFSFLFMCAALGQRFRQILLILTTLAAYWTVAAVLAIYDAKNADVIETEGRWLVLSHGYKAKVLAQPASGNEELKHIEWDGWGFAGMDTNVYLVFDPTDSLSLAAKSHRAGKYDGIPCVVPFVHRLESHWYTVLFYTDESWGQRGRLDCGPSPQTNFVMAPRN